MWRVRWGSVVLKVYDKAGRVLRVEVKVLNRAGLGCGKGLGKLGEQLECVQGMRGWQLVLALRGFGAPRSSWFDFRP